MWSDRLLLWIFRHFPPRESIFKEPEGRAESEYAKEVENPYSTWFGIGPREFFNDKEVLDLGSGFGGRPVRFLEVGARRVTGIEISEELVSYSRAFAAAKAVKEERLHFVVGTGERIPLADETFDLITMYDVMEHVVVPEQVLNECWRVLRPGGTLAAVFPPYYDLWGGSHLHGYATSLPGLNLLFTTKALRSAATILMESRGIPYQRYLREESTDKLWNMNGLTVRKFQRLVRQSAFRVDMMRYIGRHDRRMTKKIGGEAALLTPAFWLFETAARRPLIREAFCSRICALLRK
jgi:SAM-dependent methyltransferase